MRAPFALLTCALASCATTEWRHESRAAHEFYSDSNACALQAQRAFPPQAIVVQQQAPFTVPLYGDAATRGVANGASAVASARQDDNRQRFYANCLRAFGWYTVSR